MKVWLLILGLFGFIAVAWGDSISLSPDSRPRSRFIIPKGPAGNQVALGAFDLLEAYPNDTTTGTTANFLVKLTSTANAIVAGTTDTTDVIGICDPVGGSTCGNTGTSLVAIAGQINCQFDGAATVGHWVVASTTSGGRCHDAGATTPPGVQVLGVVIATTGTTNMYSVDLNNVGIMGQLAGNVAFLNVSQTFTKAQAIGPVTLTDAATITPDCTSSTDFTVTLGGNRTLANCSPAAKGGQSINFYVTQDATGSRTLAYGTNFKWAGGTAPTLTTTANHVDLVSCRTSNTTTYVCATVLDYH